jgi:Zn-dependent membrane protease YugP
MIFDPLYLILVGPALLLSLVAQGLVQTAFAKWSRVRASGGMTGAEAARRVMLAEGITDVRIEPVGGFLADHYDPRSKTLRLSHENFDSPSVAAVGIAAHEAGHAIQHARRNPMLALRSAFVPLATLGNLAFPLIFVGFLLQSLDLVKIGVVLFGTVVAFQLVTLPVEFDASRRALAALRGSGIVTPQELGGVRRVLTAAALTYVAAAAAAILQLLYFALRAGLLGGSSRDD